MIRFTVTNTLEELRQIITLQQRNLPEHLSEEDIRKEGFVTVRHDLGVLTKMHEAYPHAIAKDKEKVIGYALVMTKAFRDHIPILIPMFIQIDQIIYKGKSLQETPYFVMGQICIDKNYRGKGLMELLYGKHKEIYKSRFDFVITEISTSNQRSQKAHERIGFETIHTYRDEMDEWAIVLWDWQ